MSENRDIELVNTLLEKTRQQKLEWKPTAARNRFVVSFPEFSVMLTGGVRYGQVDKSDLTVWDADGKQVRRIRYDSDAGDDAMRQSLSELFVLVEAQQIDGDRSIDDLLAVLREQ